MNMMSSHVCCLYCDESTTLKSRMYRCHRGPWSVPRMNASPSLPSSLLRYSVSSENARCGKCCFCGNMKFEREN